LLVAAAAAQLLAVAVGLVVIERVLELLAEGGVQNRR
jgi:hypothetical protein